jgi:hypothetical protein
MKYCHRCHRTTSGKPTYCMFCRSSYDVKLCPRQHINPRAAQACSQCGSQDLSTPQPRVPLWARPLLWALSLGPGIILLAALAAYSGYFAYRVFTDPNGLLQWMCIALVLGVLLWIWMVLPDFLKRFLKRLFITSSSKDREAKS